VGLCELCLWLGLIYKPKVDRAIVASRGKHLLFRGMPRHTRNLLHMPMVGPERLKLANVPDLHELVSRPTHEPLAVSVPAESVDDVVVAMQGA